MEDIRPFRKKMKLYNNNSQYNNKKIKYKIYNYLNHNNNQIQKLINKCKKNYQKNSTIIKIYNNIQKMLKRSYKYKKKFYLINNKFNKNFICRNNKIKINWKKYNNYHNLKTLKIMLMI